MKGELFLGKYLIWVILLLGQLRGYKSCIVKERQALLELKAYMTLRTEELYLDDVFPTWTNDTKSDCCMWDGIKCNLTSRRIIGLSVGDQMYFSDSLLNLSLLHPFEELRSLNLSKDIYINPFLFNGFFDDVEGYKSLRKLKYLEILDLSSNRFNNSIFPFLNAVTSLTTLILHDNSVETLSIKELKNLTNLELLDLSKNYFNGSIRELTHLKKLKALDLSSNYISSSMELQDLKNLTNLEVLSLAENYLDGPIPTEVICEMKNLRELDLKGNHFVGQIPLCLGSLNKLRVLDLSSNQLSGNLPSSFCRLESLEYLSLLDNNFTSLFSLNPLTNLTKLKVLKLSSRSHKIQVETESTWHPKFQPSVVILYKDIDLSNYDTIQSKIVRTSHDFYLSVFVRREALDAKIVSVILETKDRRELRKYTTLPAPPHGLCLVSVKYKEDHLKLPLDCHVTSFGRHHTITKCKLSFY